MSSALHVHCAYCKGLHGRAGYAKRAKCAIRVLSRVVSGTIHRVFSGVENVPGRRVIAGHCRGRGTRHGGRLRSLRARQGGTRGSLLTLGARILTYVGNRDILPERALTRVVATRRRGLARLRGLYRTTDRRLRGATRLVSGISQLCSRLVSCTSLCSDTGFRTGGVVIGRLVHEMSMCHKCRVGVSFGFSLAPCVRKR